MVYFVIFISFLIEIHVSSVDPALHCLPRSQKRDARLIWVKEHFCIDVNSVGRVVWF